MARLDLTELRKLFEQELMKSLSRPTDEGEFYSRRLRDSIHYALVSPGKRLRPLMVLALAIANRKAYSLPSAIRLAMPCALAMEYVHTYSLIHDDLPAMDNEDFRRGRLSLHRRFDEGLAILTGDALLADAFFWLGFTKHNSARLCRDLAQAAGGRGLAAGQSEDLNRDNKRANRAYKFKINRAKTSRLFEVSAS